MKNGKPDWERFAIVIGDAIAQVRPRNGQSGLRAFGEMVGLLWNARQFDAAIRLEKYWNRLLSRSAFRLYCSYSMDVFDPELHNERMDDVLCAHSYLLPSQPNGKLNSAIWMALDEVLGPKAHEFRNLGRTRRLATWMMMPEAESVVLWLIKNLPKQVRTIVERARYHYDRQAEAAA